MKFGPLALLVALLCAPASVAHGADGAVSATVGLKMWMPIWQTWFTPVPDARTNPGANDTVIAASSDAEFIPIPAVTVRVRNVFVSGSYFESPEYTFHPYTDRDSTGVELSAYARAERQEAEYAVGYQFSPRISALVGWKTVRQDFSVNVFQGTTPVSSGSFTADYTGPYVGASLGTAIRGPVGAFGNFAFGLMESDPGADATYATTEVGLVYVVTRTVQASLGYKIQTIHVDFAPAGSQSTQTASDETQGVTFGVHAHFP